MANNLLYLKSKRTGERVCLAKYYPSTGWYTIPTIRELPDFLHRHSFGDVTFEYAEKEGIKAKGGMTDSDSFEIEFRE